MKYSYNWLKELSGTKLSPEKAVELLTMHSFEIEGIEKLGSNFPGVIVAEIIEIKKHPNADKLQLATLNAGSGRDLTVVCGAPNIEVGQKVPLALVGTKLPNGIEIKEAQIRGETSNGMLCAEDELGLGKDHSGIIILDKNAKVGESVDKYLGINDTVIEIKVLPDRAHDAMSHIGVAREIAALEGKKMEYDFPGLKITKAERKNANKSELKINIKDSDLCSRYIGAVMTNIEIKESPKWLRDRLVASGMNAINNVVDATNYVMLELGQPLHAFDFFKISGEISNDKLQISNKSQNPNDQNAKIIIRRAKDSEKIELLDGDIKELNSSDLLITNGEAPLALAGIKGGLNSGISENTKTVILEAANFNATNIRKTRTRLNIKTDSSDRFEKEIDPNLTEKAMARLIEIIEHIANGKLEEIVDVYPRPIKPWKINLDLDYVNNLLGEYISENKIINILNTLEIIAFRGPTPKKSKSIRGRTPKDSGNINFAIPTFRLDLRTQEDLIEEIGRIYGYDKIKSQPLVEPVVPPKINEQTFFEQETREKMTGLGFSEVYNYSFYSQKDTEICGLDKIKHYELANPQNPDQQLVRVSLIPNVIKNIKENLKHFSELKIFEIGRVYMPDSKSPREERKLIMTEVLEADKDAKTFFSIKGTVENILEMMGIDAKFTAVNAEDLPLIAHPTRSAAIMVGNEKIGIIGEINPIVLERYKIKKRVAIAKFNLEILQRYASKEKTYKPLPKFPIVTRDISLIIEKNILVEDIAHSIIGFGLPLVKKVELFDTHYMDNNKISHAFHIHLGTDRTLEGKEVDEIMQKIISGLEKELKVEVRK